MIKNDKLLNLVADLVEKLVEFGCSEDELVETLKYYGFTEEQIEDWYGLQHSGFESYNDSPYGQEEEE